MPPPTKRRLSRPDASATAAAAAAAPATTTSPALPAFAARIAAPAVPRPSWRRALSAQVERPVVGTSTAAAAAAASATAAAAPYLVARSHWWAVGAAALVGVLFPSGPAIALSSSGAAPLRAATPPTYEVVFSGTGSSAVPTPSSLLERGTPASVGVLPPAALSTSVIASPSSAAVTETSSVAAAPPPSVVAAAPTASSATATAAVPTPLASFFSPIFPGSLTDAEICLRLVVASLVGVVVALESRTPFRSTLVALVSSVAMTLAPPHAAGLVARSTALALLGAAVLARGGGGGGRGRSGGLRGGLLAVVLGAAAGSGAVRMAAASTLVAVAVMRLPSRVARRGTAAADVAPADGSVPAEAPAAVATVAADALALGSVSMRPRRMRMRKLRSSTKG
ncbi:hypothetical protein MMPV_002084 [Pyropia vietnamensis]